MNRTALIDRLVDHIAGSRRHPRGMAGFMIEDEIAAGRKVIQPGSCSPFAFPAEDWAFPQVVSYDTREVRLVAIHAVEPGSGALTRLLSNIRGAGLSPVICAPVGVVMPAILKRWRWRCTHHGSGMEQVDEWRPPSNEGDQQHGGTEG